MQSTNSLSMEKFLQIKKDGVDKLSTLCYNKDTNNKGDNDDEDYDGNLCNVSRR